MKIRLPADLKTRIEQASAANNRTMNAEIVARLEATFPPSETQKPRDYFEDYRAGTEARREIDMINTHILMLESESTRLHRQLLEARVAYDAAIRNGDREKAVEIDIHMDQLKEIARAADEQASSMRERLHSLPGFDLPHARSLILGNKKPKPPK